MKKILIGALVGLAAGLPGGWFGNAHFAEGLGLDGDEIEAVVLEERREDERLVLMLQAEDETILATFSERPDDVAQLVAPGDTVTLFVRADSPFADDVPILSVRRGERAAEEEAAAEEAAAEEAETSEDELAEDAEGADAEGADAEDADADAEDGPTEEGGAAEGSESGEEAAPLLTRGRT
ncbi:MAG: hypothetical protein RLO52_28015 [Sandaracinaceae bacterium]